jgi:DNA-binding response OmpR family regulator
VDIRADMYGLGATIYYCLTGKTPYHFLGSKARDLTLRLTTPPQGPKATRAEVPDEMDALVLKMLALKPEERPATPTVVMEALKPFLPPGSDVFDLETPAEPSSTQLPETANLNPDAQAVPHVLIVDGDEAIREACTQAVKNEGLTFDAAGNAKEAEAAAKVKPPDLVLLADKLPDQPGLTLLRKLRLLSTSPRQKVLMLVGGGEGAVKQILAAGADDYLAKPLDPDQLAARLRTARELKEAQDQADRQVRQLAAEKEAADKKEADKPKGKEAESGKAGLLSGFKKLFGKK